MGTVLYTAQGKVYKYEVSYPGSGTRYYVTKRSKSGGKVGGPQAFSSEAAAKFEADRRARSEGMV